jgi:hypothetical protein
MGIDYIRKFLRPPEKRGSYSNELLAVLQAHTESGRLSYSSCCCLIGIPTADHALHSSEAMVAGDPQHKHLEISRLTLAFALQAEEEFFLLGPRVNGDRVRRERLLPLIREEMERREIERQPKATGELAAV